MTHILAGQSPIRYWRPRQDSNLRPRLRRAVLYPLSYGGQPGMPRDEKTISADRGGSRIGLCSTS